MSKGCVDSSGGVVPAGWRARSGPWKGLHRWGPQRLGFLSSGVAIKQGPRGPCFAGSLGVPVFAAVLSWSIMPAANRAKWCPQPFRLVCLWGAPPAVSTFQLDF